VRAQLGLGSCDVPHQIGEEDAPGGGILPDRRGDLDALTIRAGGDADQVGADRRWSERSTRQVGWRHGDLLSKALRLRVMAILPSNARPGHDWVSSAAPHDDERERPRHVCEDGAMDALNAELVPLEGGHTGVTFLAIGPEGPSVVRMYTDAGDRRGPDAANIDAELLKWMRGLLPVPEVLEVRRPDAALGLPALLVTSRLQGVRGDHVLGSLDSGGRGRVAKELAKILVRLS